MTPLATDLINQRYIRAGGKGEPSFADPPAIIALSDAIEALRRTEERKTPVVDLRYFGGWGVEEIGASLGIFTETVRGDLRLAEAWLRREIDKLTVHPA